VARSVGEGQGPGAWGRGWALSLHRQGDKTSGRGTATPCSGDQGCALLPNGCVTLGQAQRISGLLSPFVK
jgi:hypothetical protein